MKISIQDASSDDINIINNILRLSKAYWGYDDEFLDRFMQKLGVTHEYMDKHTVKLFYIDAQLVGFFNFGINSENLFELDNFFLHPEYIGQGLGRKLWHTCCQIAIEQGRNEFIIWSDPNTESFYLKMGCEKIGVRQSPVMPNRYPAILKYKIS